MLDKDGSDGQLAYIELPTNSFVDIIEELLYYSAEDALSTIGEPMRQAFLWHLRHEGVPFSSANFDFNQFESKLTRFFGVGAPVIVQQIYYNFMNRAMQEGYFSPEMILRLEKLPKSRNVEKFLRRIIQEQGAIRQKD